MDLHSIKLRLQQHLSDGLVIIAGSGLSCAEGLPGMQELAEHLCNEFRGKFTGADAEMWISASKLIATEGLESALIKIPPTPNVESAIVATVSNIISVHERSIICNIFLGSHILRLTRLLKYIVKPETYLPIITTNYDRLVEIAVEEAGLGVNTMFVGHFSGKLDKNESRYSFCRSAKLIGRKVHLTTQLYALVCKPHGSLDWYSRNGIPVSYTGDLLNCERLIITPGQNKYRNGYNSPFDIHLSQANSDIDKASRFLIIGYGFNDDHLQTHLIPNIKNGKDTLILTYSLSEKARCLALENRNVISIEHADMDGTSGSSVIVDQVENFFPGIEIWDVDSFIEEVLMP